MCVSVCCVRASPCTTHAIGHLRPPPLPSSPRYVPLQKRENRRRDEEDDGATKRAIGGTGTAVSARYAFTRGDAASLSVRRYSFPANFHLPFSLRPFRPSRMEYISSGKYGGSCRSIRLEKKRGRERSVVSMRNRRTLCFDEQEGEGRKIDNVCFSNFLKFFPFAKKKKKKGIVVENLLKIVCFSLSEIKVFFFILHASRQDEKDRPPNSV